MVGPRVAGAYVAAFQLGYRILAGVAVLQFGLCLGLRRVTLGNSIASEETTCEVGGMKQADDLSESTSTVQIDLESK